MALATQCPFCQTTFRVANDQLKLRDGLVRCGNCHEVFDGNAHLLADQQSGGNWPASPPSSTTPASAPLITPAIARANAAAPHYGEPPAATLPDAETMAEIEAAWDLPSLSAADEIPAPAEGDADADAGADTLMIESDDSNHSGAAPLLLQPSSTPHDDASQAEDRASRDSYDRRDDAQYRADREEKFDAPDESIDQPEFILAAQRRQRRARARRIAMIVLSVILLFTALAQGLYLARNRLALAAPTLKPLLVAACQPLRCTVGLQRQIDQLSIEANELQAATPGQPTLTLSLLLRNRGDIALAWPDIELTLNDEDENALIRRVFTPAEYLPAGQTVEAGMAGDTEQPVKLSFTLAQDAASGYRVYLFYP